MPRSGEVSKVGASKKQASPKKRAKAERTIKPRGQTTRDDGGDGAPQGGQDHGRQGDQQGIKY